MKNHQFVCALLCGAVALASCNKNLSKDEYPLPEEGEKCVLNVNAFSSLQVKSTGEAGAVAENEKIIGTLQVFVFRDDMLDAYGTGKGPSMSLTCTAGDREVYALVNAPDMSSISSKTKLLSHLIDLNANATKALVMFGSSTAKLPTTSAVNISVTRMVSRIVVHKITRNFESASLNSLTFKINSIYVRNAAGNGSISGKVAVSKWYNGSSAKSDLPTLLYDSVSATVAKDASYTTPHYFYTMPNDNSENTTRVVIDATLGTKTYYYPVDLPALERNKSYEFTEIKIKRPGSDDVDTPVTTSDISFNVNVVDWTLVSVTEEI